MKPEILNLFQEKGYTTQSSIARALCDLGYYSNAHSLSAFLSQIFSGKRRCPKDLKLRLIELSENPELANLLEYSKPTSLEGRIFEKADIIWDKLLNYQRLQNEDQLLIFYSEFKVFAKKYIEV